MADNKDDVEEQRRLAKDWKPEVDGPLVGPIASTTDFIADFPPSDSRYEKIKNLTVEFPHYRSMKRDGSCGYRALAFGFLFNLCNPVDDVEKTSSRLKDTAEHFDSLQSLFVARGWDAFIYEDWLAACVKLCNDLASIVSSSSSSSSSDASKAPADTEAMLSACAALLSERLNDEAETGIEVLQYLRALTSSWMLAHEAEYAPFVALEAGVTGSDGLAGVRAWCEINVDPPSAEMEEQSLLALYQAVVRRTGMAVHVHYLERSAGDRLMVSQYEPEPGAEADTAVGKTAAGVALPAVELLYRP